MAGERTKYLIAELFVINQDITITPAIPCINSHVLTFISDIKGEVLHSVYSQPSFPCPPQGEEREHSKDQSGGIACVCIEFTSYHTFSGQR